jgi:hypothetical protein
MALCHLLAALALLVGALVMGATLVSAGVEPAAMPMQLAPIVLGAFVLLGFSTVYVVAGAGVVQGRRRGLQTVLAVLNLCGCPGVFYAGYALWVCYGNEASKQVFDEGGLLE